MNYPFLKTNLEVLAGQNDPIYEWIRQQEPETIIPKNIRTNRWGALDWEFKQGLSLFQTLPPQKAYESWNAIDCRPADASLVVGGNLGYGLHFLLKKTVDSHRILLLEPRIEMLLATLGLTDFSSALKQGRLILIPPQQTHLRGMVYRLTLACLFGKVFLRPDLPSLQLGPEYDLWTRYSREALEDMRVELYTLRNRQDRIMQNELVNLARAGKERNLLALKGRAAGLKAVQLGAGPSLEQFAPFLAEHPGRALYVTALQTLPALQRLGLKPHLCLALECDPLLGRVYEKLDRDWARNIPLIYAVSAAPEAIKMYPGPTLPLWTRGGLAAPLLADQDLLMEPGGNVALTTLRFLDWCGADQVMLVGHDFAWQGTRTHARDHLAAEQAFRFDPKNDCALKNQTDELIYSNPVYLAALRDLEAEIEHLNMPVYNLYGGGLAIQGSRTLTWDEVAVQGHLAGQDKNRDCFLKKFQTGPCAPIRFSRPADRSEQIAFLKNLKKRLKQLFRRREPNAKTIKTIFGQAFTALEQDPWSKPYLFNDLLNLAGLVQVSPFFGQEEFMKCMKIVTKMVEKLQEMNRKIASFMQIQGI